MAPVVAFQRTDEPHNYRVLLNGEEIGQVWRVRFANDSVAPGRQSNRSGPGEGHWGWCADTAPEGEYPTRREAVEDMREVSKARRPVVGDYDRRIAAETAAYDAACAEFTRTEMIKAKQERQGSAT